MLEAGAGVSGGEIITDIKFTDMYSTYSTGREVTAPKKFGAVAKHIGVVTREVCARGKR